MLDRIKTDLAPLILRWMLAVIFVSHGFLKLYIPHEGASWAGNLLHPNVALLVAWGELLCGIALAVGLLTRIAALGIAVIQLGAIALVTQHREFIHDLLKPGPESGFRFTSVGYEYNAALVAMCVAVILLGGGMFSIDYLLFGRRGAKPATTPATTTPAAAQPALAASGAKTV
jgi:putative oxidoreductase